MSQNVNPYESPRTSAAPQLSRYEQQVLETYLRFRMQPPTILSLLRASLLYWLIVGGIFAIGLTLMSFASSLPGVGSLSIFSYGLVSGLIIGAASRDIHFYRRLLKNLPIMMRIIDWQRLERYLHHGTPD